MERIYLDYAASTPVDEGVLRAMGPYFTKEFGNPGSLHSFGQRGLGAVDASREMIAKFVGASFRDVVFTASATEANNLILRGVVKSYRLKVEGLRSENKKNRKPSTLHLPPHVIISAIEHESILETARDLERDGVSVTYLPVDAFGFVNRKIVRSALREETALVSIMYANNEIGTIQPIAEIGDIIRQFRKEKAADSGFYPLFHTDASQAVQFLECAVNKLGVDAMTFSAHKIYGPKGIGGLYIKEEARKENLVSSVLTGGGQEYGLRSGTENVPLIVGFAEAVRVIERNRKNEAERIAQLRSRFWRSLSAIARDATPNGARESDIADALLERNIPSILNVHFSHKTSEALLTKLDLHGVAAGAGSACRSRSFEPSHVLRALYPGTECSKESIRFSFGRPTTEDEIDKALAVIKMVL